MTFVNVLHLYFKSRSQMSQKWEKKKIIIITRKIKHINHGQNIHLITRNTPLNLKSVFTLKQLLFWVVE